MQSKPLKKAVTERASGEALHFRRDLWHEVLFYTSGELVAKRIPGYVPYAEKNGLWARAWPGPSLANLVTELAAPPTQ